MKTKKMKTNFENESRCLDSMGLEEGIIVSVRSGSVSRTSLSPYEHETRHFRDFERKKKIL